MYDVICVGAGPSGSLSGFLLAEAGFNVAIIEKKDFPRIKICGGGLSQKAFKIVEKIIDFSQLKGRVIHGSYLCFKREHLCKISQNITTYSINRSEFDHKLCKAAVQKGCDIFMPAQAKEISENDKNITVQLKGGKEIKSKYLILAEGINGRLHKRIGYIGRHDCTMGLEVDVYPKEKPEALNHNTLFDFGSIDHGYGWIFPKDDHLNIGAYYYCSRKINQNQIKALEEFIRHFTWAKASQIGRIKAYPLPYNINYSRYNTDRTILVGDCAGAVENFYGGGLYYGFLTSQIAASVLKYKILRNQSLDDYTKIIQSKILAQIRMSRIIARRFYGHQRFGYYMMARNKLMNTYYAKLIHGDMSPRQTFYCTILSLPIALLCPNLKRKDFSELD